MASAIPSERRTIAQLGAHLSWAGKSDEERTARTAAGRAAFESRFADENERRAHFLRMALKSAQARRARAVT